MVIHGFQKMTLVDFPGLVASILFTGGCNFRCPFCQNGSLVLHPDTEPVVSEEEIFSYLEKRRKMIEGVVITGGEPTLQNDLLPFAGRIRALGFKTKLDTNGYRPAVLKEAVREGLFDYVAMDIKNSPEKYGVTIGLDDYDMENVEASAGYLMQGNIPYEFRTTVVREFHKRDDFEAIGRWLAGAEKYYLQAFEDSGDLIRPGLRAYTKEIMDQALDIVRRYVPNAELRGI